MLRSTANLFSVARFLAIVRLAALIVEYCHSNTRPVLEKSKARFESNVSKGVLEMLLLLLLLF